MLRKLLVLPLALSLVSCSSLIFYPQDEFVTKYSSLDKDFDKTLEQPFSNRDLKKIKRKFLSFRRQLTFNNKNFARIDEPTVNKYSSEINYHLNIIEDLKD